VRPVPQPQAYGLVVPVFRNVFQPFKDLEQLFAIDIIELRGLFQCSRFLTSWPGKKFANLGNAASGIRHPQILEKVSPGSLSVLLEHWNTPLFILTLLTFITK